LRPGAGGRSGAFHLLTRHTLDRMSAGKQTVVHETATPEGAPHPAHEVEDRLLRSNRRSSTDSNPSIVLRVGDTRFAAPAVVRWVFLAR